MDGECVGRQLGAEEAGPEDRQDDHLGQQEPDEPIRTPAPIQSESPA